MMPYPMKLWRQGKIQIKKKSPPCEILAPAAGRNMRYGFLSRAGAIPAERFFMYMETKYPYYIKKINPNAYLESFGFIFFKPGSIHHQ